MISDIFCPLILFHNISLKIGKWNCCTSLFFRKEKFVVLVFFQIRFILLPSSSFFFIFSPQILPLPLPCCLIKDPFSESNFPFFSQLLPNLQPGNIKFFRSIFIFLYQICPLLWFHCVLPFPLNSFFQIRLYYCPLLHFPIYFALKFCPRPCPGGW